MSGIAGFSMPKEMVAEKATATPTYAKFITEPWEKGFGHTLGNTLRRILLSSMDGVAVSSVKIDGVPHEFSTIENVHEDVTEIILNIKNLHLTCDGELPRKIELVASKAGPVTAACVKEDGVTQVLNPELHICTLDRDRPLRMEIEIDRGRGYRPAEENKRDDHPIGVIPVDSLFSPVERVRYDVQACRVGQRTDYDRLEIEVWTDGRIDPESAMRQSAHILTEFGRVFTGDTFEVPAATAETTAPVAAAIAAAASTPLSPENQAVLDQLLKGVNDLDLTVRAKNCLSNAEIRILGELVEKSEDEMLKCRNFGKKSLEEIKGVLQPLGLDMGMTLPDDVRQALHAYLATMKKESANASS